MARNKWDVTPCNCGSPCKTYQILGVLPAEAHLSKDDAYVISAAYDMRDALRHVMGRDHEYKEWCDMCKLAEIALKKADGEAGPQ